MRKITSGWCLVGLCMVFSVNTNAKATAGGFAPGEAVSMPVLLQPAAPQCSLGCNKLVKLADEYVMLFIKDGQLIRAMLFDEKSRDFHSANERQDGDYDEILNGVVLSTSNHYRCNADCDVRIGIESFGVLLVRFEKTGIVSVKVESEEKPAPGAKRQETAGTGKSVAP